MSNVKFLFIYLVAMIPTYFLRYFLIGAVFTESQDPESLNVIGNLVMGLLLLCYVGMSLVTYFRGKAIGKSYIVAFPIVSGVFDIILLFIPFVPTVMNIITIVLAMPSPKNNEVSNT